MEAVQPGHIIAKFSATVKTINSAAFSPGILRLYSDDENYLFICFCPFLLSFSPLLYFYLLLCFSLFPFFLPSRKLHCPGYKDELVVPALTSWGDSVSQPLSQPAQKGVVMLEPGSHPDLPGFFVFLGFFLRMKRI